MTPMPSLSITHFDATGANGGAIGAGFGGVFGSLCRACTMRIDSSCQNAFLDKKHGGSLSNARIRPSVSSLPDSEHIPLPEEFVGEWFRDEEIYGFISDNLEDIPTLDIRYYLQSVTMKKQGLDWKAALLETWTNEPDDTAEGIVASLVNNPEFVNEEARVECFECMMAEAGVKGGSRATYYRIKDRIKKKR